jgi:hypothetical protein
MFSITLFIAGEKETVSFIELSMWKATYPLHYVAVNVI